MSARSGSRSSALRLKKEEADFHAPERASVPAAEKMDGALHRWLPHDNLPSCGARGALGREEDAAARSLLASIRLPRQRRRRPAAKVLPK
jgi:hypothetical protein